MNLTSRWIGIMAAGCLSAGVALAQPASYAVGPEDVLQITVFAGGAKEEEYSVTVSPSGSIVAPLIGEVKVAGQSPQQVGQTLKTLLARDYLVRPEVLVAVKEYGGKIMVLGEVRSPGIYPLREGLTALSACVRAGGFTDFAAAKRVRVTRVVDKRTVQFEVDLAKVSRGKGQDLALASGDRIEVPRRLF